MYYFMTLFFGIGLIIGPVMVAQTLLKHRSGLVRGAGTAERFRPGVADKCCACFCPVGIGGDHGDHGRFVCRRDRRGPRRWGLPGMESVCWRVICSILVARLARMLTPKQLWQRRQLNPTNAISYKLSHQQ